MWNSLSRSCPDAPSWYGCSWLSHGRCNRRKNTCKSPERRLESPLETINSIRILFSGAFWIQVYIGRNHSNSTGSLDTNLTGCGFVSFNTWFEKFAIVWFRIFHSRSFPRLGGGQEVVLGPFPGRKWSTRLLWRLLLHNPLVLPVFLDGRIRCRHTNCSAKRSRV